MSRDARLAALAVAAFVLAFLATPIARVGDGAYSPADVTQNWTLTRVDDGVVPGNDQLSDLAVQMEPWLQFGRQEIASGRFPLLNPWNGGGVPHFANYQSAVLSPFSLPFYVLPAKLALLATAFAKLFALAFFTYLFLRQIQLTWVAALSGAVAFAFAGHNVLLLGYPHTSALVALPAGLTFAERWIARHERGERGAANAWDALGLCASLVLGLLAGHPETACFALVLVGAWIVARLGRLAVRDRSLARVVPLALGLGAAAASACALAAIQVVPFLEYLRESRALDARAGPQTPISLVTWPLTIFPNLLGNPSTSYAVSNRVPPPDFETANLGYVGGAALAAAALGVFGAWRSWSARLFTIVALAWFTYAHDLFGAGALASRIPLFGQVPLNRSQPIWSFSIAVLAAFGVESAWRAGGPRRAWRSLALVLGAALALAAFRAGALRQLESAHAYLRDAPKRALFLSAGPEHVAWVTTICALGVAAIVALQVARGRVARGIAGALVVVALFVPSGWLLRDYVPVSADRHHFPRTELALELRTRAAGAPVGILGTDALPPATNILYGVALTANYDALGVRRYDELYQDAFGGADNWRTWTRSSVRGLELFGVERVLSKTPWLAVDAPFADLPFNPRAFVEVGEILPGREVVQTFTALDDCLQAVQYRIGTYGRRNACTLDVTLEDAVDGTVLAEQRVDCRELAMDPFGMHGPTLLVPTLERAFGRELRLRIASHDARPGNAVSVWRRSDMSDWVNRALWRADRARGGDDPGRTPRPHADVARWSLTFGGEPLEGGLALDLSASLQRFEREADIGPFGVYRLRGAGTRYRSVVRGEVVESDADARLRVLDPSFDATNAVVLVRGSDGVRPDDAARSSRSGDFVGGPLEVLSESADSVRLGVHLPRTGWIATARPWYPGWTARADGVEVPIVRVNHAFLGVSLPNGAEELELVYAPGSLRLGIGLSLLGALGLAATLFRLQRAARV